MELHSINEDINEHENILENRLEESLESNLKENLVDNFEKDREREKQEVAYIVSELMFCQLMKQPEHIRSKVLEMLQEHLKKKEIAE